MKIVINQIFNMFFLYILFFSTPAYTISLFSEDENILWKAGLNQYIKLAKQDDSKFGKNDHPVELNVKEVNLALKAIVFQEKGFFSSKKEGYLSTTESFKHVFSFQQAKLISEAIAKGLRKAKPQQDIIFTLSKSSRDIFGLTGKRIIAGRIFFKEKKLNIIIGEYDFFQSHAFESAYDPSGRGAVPYNLNLGKRSRASKAFAGSHININVPGIDNKRLNKFRFDWFVIDVKVAAEAYIALKENKGKPSESTSDKAIKLEAAKIAKQQRQMRAEMARMRKEFKENTEATASTKSVKERMLTLDELLGDKLISREEYDSKRKQILNDI